MTVGAWLKKAVSQLSKSGIGTARLDALVLLEDVARHDRAWLLAHPEHGLSPAEAAKLTKLLNSRSAHTPLAYVRGHTEFYGYNFVITPSVLEPRPESETMIELLLALAAQGAFDALHSSKPLRIADVGAGSGALGITAKLVLEPRYAVSVDLLEIDPAAIETAKTNVEKHTTNISMMRSDLLTQSPQDYDVLLCNLPYVPDSHTINQAASKEPAIAIFGGPDGLDLYRALFSQLDTVKRRPLYILTESLPPQHDALQAIATKHGYTLRQTDDFIQVFASLPAPASAE